MIFKQALAYLWRIYVCCHRLGMLLLLMSLWLLSATAQAAQVNLLNSSAVTATGAGTTGTPSLSNFNIPAGKNRVLFIWAAFERDHCAATDNCTNSNTTGTGLGDNWPVMPFSSTAPQLTARVVGSGGSIDKKNALTIGGTPSGDLRFHYIIYAPSPSTGSNGLVFYSASSYHIALRENEIQQVLGSGATSGVVNISLPDLFTSLSTGDDAALIVSVYENVDQTDNGFVRNAMQQLQLSSGGSAAGNFTLTIPPYDTGQAPNEATDGLVVTGFNSTTEGFLTPSGYTSFAAVTTTNNNGLFDGNSGGYYTSNDPNGFSANAFFRNNNAAGTVYSLQSAASNATPTLGGGHSRFSSSLTMMTPVMPLTLMV